MPVFIENEVKSENDCRFLIQHGSTYVALFFNVSYIWVEIVI